MDAEFQGIKKILEIYLNRSELALAALAADDWNRFEDLMRWRAAAYHNFRAADHLASLKRADYLQDPELKTLGQAVQNANQVLTDEMEKQRERLNQKLLKISRHRSKIGKFYSGVQEQSGFQKSV
jgi:hypothetical protein